jgi:cell wall-associated NlpC family hydrolase
MTFDKYVGLPFIDGGRDVVGVDCWGLVWLANRDERCIELPIYSDRYTSASDTVAINTLIKGEIGPWVEIAAGQEQPWDCVLIREGRLPRHIGLVVAPGRMLHIQRGFLSAIENYRSSKFKDRVVGLYRHRQR